MSRRPRPTPPPLAAMRDERRSLDEPRTLRTPRSSGEHVARAARVRLPDVEEHPPDAPWRDVDAELRAVRRQIAALSEQLRDLLDTQRSEAEAHADDDRPDDHPALLRSDAIAEREFPVRRKGYAPEAVGTWLQVVALSHRLLEQELERARAAWERSIRALAEVAERARSGDGVRLAADELARSEREWERSTIALSAGRRLGSDGDLRARLVRAALRRPRFRRSPLGFAASEVRRAMHSSATELAVLEEEVAALRSENEDLRARLVAALASRAHAPGRPDGDGARDLPRWVTRIAT